MDTSILTLSHSLGLRGLNLGSLNAALMALIRTPSIRGSWATMWPMHPRRDPSVVRVTKVPRFSEHMGDSTTVGRRCGLAVQEFLLDGLSSDRKKVPPILFRQPPGILHFSLLSPRFLLPRRIPSPAPQPKGGPHPARVAVRREEEEEKKNEAQDMSGIGRVSRDRVPSFHGWCINLPDFRPPCQMEPWF